MEREEKRSLIARFRCGNEIRGNQHWLEKEDRKCRICGKGTDNTAYVLKECKETREEMTVEDFMKEDNKG